MVAGYPGPGRERRPRRAVARGEPYLRRSARYPALRPGHSGREEPVLLGGTMAEPEGNDRVETDLGTVAGVTDRGLVHERNEDAMALGRWPDGTVAAVVCDGVSTSLTPQQASRT